MRILIREIEFDFELDLIDFVFTQEEMDAITNEWNNVVLDVTEEDDIADTISDLSGYLIRSLDYEIVSPCVPLSEVAQCNI